MRERVRLVSRKKSAPLHAEKHPARQLPRVRGKPQKSEHIRVDTHPDRRFPHPLEHFGPHGTLKDVNSFNPMLHPHKDHKRGENLFSKPVHKYKDDE